jgi:hypothetical protein
MNHNDHQWPWLDLGTYQKNRRNFPHEQLIPYEGKQVAFNVEGTRILASGDTVEEVFDQLAEAGIDSDQVVISFIDPPDRVNL